MNVGNLNLHNRIMLNEAVSHYHELLQQGDIAEASRRTLDEGLENARLIFGGRRLSPYLRPHFVTEADWTRVSGICEIVWSAIQKVKNRTQTHPALLDELGITDIERELVAVNPGYTAVSPTARLDSFLTETAYSFVELNGESPAGIAYADAALDIFSTLPVMRKFQERYTVTAHKGSHLMLEVLLGAYQEYLGRKPDTAPRIAIVDLSDRPTVKEFELFREFFERHGFPSVICVPEQLEYKDGELSFEGEKIDIVYKRLLVNEYLPVMNDAPALWHAYRDGAVCMVNSFQSKIIHKKALFAVLTDEKYTNLFNHDEQRIIAAHVPWTRMLGDTRTRHNEREIELLDFAVTNQSRLVLKPNDDYGGHGISIGWNTTAAEWQTAIDEALRVGDYILQERVPTAREQFPALTDDGGIEFAEQLVDLDPLLFNGKVGSAFTRLSASELANVSSGGGMVPTFVISEKKT